MRAPTAFVEFCIVRLVSRVTGEPLIKTELAPNVCLAGPITVPEATPILTPALSPVVMGKFVAMLCTGEPANKIFMALVMPVGPCIHSTPLSIGKHDISLTNMNLFGIYFGDRFCRHHGVLGMQSDIAFSLHI